MKWIIAPFVFLWSRRTTAMGYITVLWGVIELNPGVVGDWVAKPKRGTLILIIGMINAAIGHYNNALIKRLQASRGPEVPE
jgi:hypothetical protein